MVHLSGFISSSAFGIVGHNFNPRNMALLGSFIQGLAVLMFGILELIDDKSMFLSISFILRNVHSLLDTRNNYSLQQMIASHYFRGLEGIGTSISMSSFPVIFMYLYPDKVATINSWSETALGVGYSVGPALGGFLYDAGGFHLPFVAMGVANIMFASSILVSLQRKETGTTTHQS